MFLVFVLVLSITGNNAVLASNQPSLNKEENEIILFENGKKNKIIMKETEKFRTTILYNDKNEILHSFAYDKVNDSITSATTGKTIYFNSKDKDIKAISNRSVAQYCTPGEIRDLSPIMISYADMITAIGLSVSVSALYALVLAKAGGVTVINTTVEKAIKSELSGIVLTLTGMAKPVQDHGIRINLGAKCELMHYVDNAWGDDEWFYGEKTYITGSQLY